MSESEANTMSLNTLSNKGTAQNRKRVGRGMGCLLYTSPSPRDS